MSQNDYAKKQKEYYSTLTSSDEDLKAVVGAFESHQKYPYEKYLLENIRRTKSNLQISQMKALDFGCAGGRMILRMSKLLGRINYPRLFVNSGDQLDNIEDDYYDLVYTTVAFHHIASYKVRQNLLKEFYRVLKNKGQISLQLLYSDDPTEFWRTKGHISWLEEPIEFIGSNGACDVRITPKNIHEVKQTIEDIGFKNFKYELKEPPYAGVKEQSHWIFLYAEK